MPDRAETGRPETPDDARDRGRRVARNSGWQLVAQLVGMLAGPLIFRLIDPATYGQLGSIMAAFGVVTQWVGFRSGETTTKFLGRFLVEAGRQRQVVLTLRLGYLLDATAGIAAFVLLAALSGWGAEAIMRDRALAGLVVVYALSALFLIPQPTASSALRAADRYDAVFWLQFWQSVLRVAGVLAIGWLPVEVRLAALVWLQVLVNAFFGLGSWWLARRTLGRLDAVAWDRSAWREMAGFRREMGHTLLSSNVISKLKPLYKGLDVLLVSRWFGPLATGHFASARRLAEMLGVLAPAVQLALGPELPRLWSAARYREALALVNRAAMLVALVGAPLAVAFAAVLDPLLSWWQPSYLPCIPAARYLILGTWVLCAASPYYTFLMSTHRPWTATWSTACGTLFQLLALAAAWHFGQGVAPEVAAARTAACLVTSSFAGVIVNAVFAVVVVRQSERDRGESEPVAKPG